jgi:hypothetical protein
VYALVTRPSKPKPLASVAIYHNTSTIEINPAKIVTLISYTIYPNSNASDVPLALPFLYKTGALPVLTINTSISAFKTARRAVEVEIIMKKQINANVKQINPFSRDHHAFNAIFPFTLILHKKSVYLALTNKFTTSLFTNAKIAQIKNHYLPV